MAAPTLYSEALFAQYLLDVLKDTATALGWTTQGDVQAAIDETLLALAVSTIADATEIRKLRAVGRREVWRLVASATAAHYAFSADGASYNRQQIHDHAVAALRLAETDCMAFGIDGYAVRLDKVIFAQDPYGPIPAEDVGYP